MSYKRIRYTADVLNDLVTSLVDIKSMAHSIEQLGYRYIISREKLDYYFQSNIRSLQISWKHRFVAINRLVADLNTLIYAYALIDGHDVGIMSRVMTLADDLYNAGGLSRSQWILYNAMSGELEEMTVAGYGEILESQVLRLKMMGLRPVSEDQCGPVCGYMPASIIHHVKSLTHLSIAGLYDINMDFKHDQMTVSRMNMLLTFKLDENSKFMFAGEFMDICNELENDTPETTVQISKHMIQRESA